MNKTLRKGGRVRSVAVFFAILGVLSQPMVFFKIANTGL